jgi:hypothetical protein
MQFERFYSLNHCEVVWFAHLYHLDFWLILPNLGKRLGWWRSECAFICLYTTVEGAQTPHIGMTWMWYAVWKVLQPQPLWSGMVCTPTSHRLSANSPKSGVTSVVVTEWMCIHMSIHNSWRCSNTSYRYDIDVMCSLKGSTASTIVKWYGLHTYIT